MTNSRRRWTRLLLLGPGLLLVSSAELRAQAVEARVGRFWDSAGWATFRLGVGRQLVGVLGTQLHGDVTRRDGGAAGSFAGVGTDLTLFRKPDGGPYLLAGLSGGLGSETSNAFSHPWGSWSAGVGYDLFPLDFLSVGAEGRWRELSLGGRDGVELALGVSVHFNRGIPKVPPRTSVPGSGRGQPEPAGTVSAPLEPQPPPASLADSIVATAAEAMGRPYEYGGTGEDGEGFDCSGLIQYAFGKHGIQLPRRSVDQAREGIKMDKKLEQLRPADLLTFSNRGGAVTHVGLYMGEGRFIHSATRGVQVSTLSPSDPYGRWWYKRWVGVRRIIR
ncbi:MAG TPA: C40 family peptidase [Gemmatimonadales bacterium]|nr:C40 family peptidase [Gemmatimonadales bacterium]